jgi:hypothetical protein
MSTHIRRLAVAVSYSTVAAIRSVALCVVDKGTYLPVPPSQPVYIYDWVLW